MKFKLTCSDVYQAMAREDVVVNADNLDEAFEKAKSKFCHKYKTKRMWVDITGVQKL